MKRLHVASMVIASASIAVVGVTFAMRLPQDQGQAVHGRAQDKYTLKSPSGIAFSEFKGYELWQMVASSQAENGSGCGTSPDPGCIKSILGNSTMIKAYASGIPSNGKPVPDGAVLAKIEWAKVRDTKAPYSATVPGNLAEVAFMVKDAKRFPKTAGWGYATFRYDTPSNTWMAIGDGPEFANACHACHTLVKANDFLFTHYPKR